jgi:hypothetical protein
MKVAAVGGHGSYAIERHRCESAYSTRDELVDRTGDV